MGRIRLIPLVLAGALSLTGCAAEPSFEDPEVKRQAWDVYQCKEYRERAAVSEAKAVQADLDAGRLDDVVEAKAWVQALNDAAEHSEDATVAYVMPLDNRDGMDNMCTDWPWEYRTNQDDYLDGYDAFTEDQARDAGVLVEQRQPLF